MSHFARDRLPPMIWMFRLLAILIVAGALIRALGWNDRSGVRAAFPATADVAVRQQLGFRSGVEVVSFAARPLQIDRGSSWQVAWLDSTGMITVLQPNGRSVDTAGKDADKDANRSAPADRLLIRRYRAGDGERADDEVVASQFAGVSVAAWDPDQPVYVTVGPDGQPGVAGVDDDGNGVVDDLSELGVTGSDDRVVAPGQPGYRQAASGEQIAAIISRGAVAKPTERLYFAGPSEEDAGDSVAALAAGTAAGELPREVWLEFWPADEATGVYRVLLP